MAVISRTPNTDRAINTATLFTRTAVAVGIPLYLYLKLDSVPTLHSPPGKLIAASVVVLSAPATLYCALGALEGVVRSCVQYFKYHAGTNPAYHWDQCSKEVKTTSGLVQASVSPLAGYTFMYREWNKLGLDNDKNKPRVLKEEYITYSALRSAAHLLIDAGNWALTKLKLAYHRSVAQVTSTIQTGLKGLAWCIETTVSVVKWAWRVSQPFRELVWNIGVAVTNWSIDRIVDLWNFSKPVWKFIWNKVAVELIWTSLIKTFLGHFIFQTVLWEIALKTVVWKFLFKTVIVDIIVTKIIWNFICEFLIGKIVWPILKFVGQEILWPILKFTGNLLGNIIMIALNAIAWALQQAFRRGR
jgi:hypothetical protein